MDQLPSRLVTAIALDLSYEDIMNLCRTQRKMAKLCRSDQFWRLLLARDYPEIAMQPEPLASVQYQHLRTIDQRVEAILAQGGIVEFRHGNPVVAPNTQYLPPEVLRFLIDLPWFISRADEIQAVSTHRDLLMTLDLLIGSESLYLRITGGGRPGFMDVIRVTRETMRRLLRLLIFYEHPIVKI